ncbi:MAG: hypothetical protein Q8P49_04375, partial [Candidatus Liptonbacteria bacterium]|nr:hypothetical protein [Candidatus Liptonbacteria bacterium]
MNVLDLKRLLQTDEAACWDLAKYLRDIDIPGSMANVGVSSRDQAISRGVEIVRRILKLAVSSGLDFESFEPGHGSGHLTRDYVNALRLLTKLDADPREVFIGFVGGVLHDFS